MTSTAVLTDDSTTIVAEEGARFSWGIVLAGAVAATATTFFLLTLGAGVGLGFLALPATAKAATTFITLGAIYFLASQAFGFAVGGYLVGRLIGPEVETNKEEEFRAAAHGFAMWAVAVVASLLIAIASAALGGSAVLAGAASRNDNAIAQSYWVDEMFRAAPFSAQVTADKAEAGRILAMHAATPLTGYDRDRLAHLVSEDAGVSAQAGMDRVAAAEDDMRQAADNARKAASVLSFWTAFALLFGAIVAVAAAVSARWMDDRISFSWTPRH